MEVTVGESPDDDECQQLAEHSRVALRARVANPRPKSTLKKEEQSKPK